MIVTLTANPSIDRTVNLVGRLERGTVLRAAATHSDPGGKGVNVARALTSAGVAAVAVLPGNEGDPLLTALSEHGIEHVTVATSGPARTNITITEPDGTTTKVNEPGVVMSAESLADLQSEIIERGSRAEWVVLSGSLPRAFPPTGTPRSSRHSARHHAESPSTRRTPRCSRSRNGSPRPPPTS